MSMFSLFRRCCFHLFHFWYNIVQNSSILAHDFTGINYGRALVQAAVGAVIASNVRREELCIAKSELHLRT